MDLALICERVKEQAGETDKQATEEQQSGLGRAEPRHLSLGLLLDKDGGRQSHRRFGYSLRTLIFECSKRRWACGPHKTYNHLVVLNAALSAE